MKSFLLATAVVCMTTGALATTIEAKPVSLMALPARAIMAVPDSIPAAAKTYHYKVFAKPDGTYGYDIFTGAKKLIHQETIPGQPGNKGFARESSAVKVAGLIISKLQQNIFPPTVTTAELKQLQAL
jgi:hypothetical protein